MSGDAAVRAVLFDFGGTLYDYDTLAAGDQEALQMLAKLAGAEATAADVQRAYRAALRLVFRSYLERRFFLHKDMFRDAVVAMLRELGRSADPEHLERYREFRLGYSLNTHHAQGATVDRTFLLAGGEMTSREAMYVQASRSRDETRIYTDQASAGEGLAQLARNAAKSRAKDLAHDHLLETEPRSLEMQQ